MILAAKLLTKVAQIFGDFLGYFGPDKLNFAVAILWSTFGKIGKLFIQATGHKDSIALQL